MPRNTGSGTARLPFDIEDVRNILAGVTEPKLLSERDRKGLTPVAYAVLKGAAASDALLALLDETSKDDQADPIHEIRELLLALGQSVLRIERKVDHLSKKAPRAGGS